MKGKKAWAWTSVAVLVAGGILFAGRSMAATESARYRVLEKKGAFEIRQYERHVVVSTPMGGSGQNDSFGRLFRYISGENADDEKIAMTTPVFMPANSAGAMTEMQFVVPARVAASGAPRPEGSSVKLKSMASGKYAVVRYNGRSDRAEQKKQLAKLREFLKENGHSVRGNAIYAGYNPPWTPGPVRRNEVLLPIR